MTLDEIIIETFDNIGRPTDISPLTELDDNSTLDPNLPGYKQIQRWVNLGYEAITKWRTPQGKFFRHRDIIKRRFCQYGPHILEGTWAEFNPDDPAFTPTHLFEFPDDDYYEGLLPPDLVWVTFDNLGADLTFDAVTPPPTTFLGSVGVTGITGLYRDVYALTNADYASLAYYTDEHTLYLIAGVPWIIPETVVTIYEKGLYIDRLNQPNDVALTDLYAIRKIRIFDMSMQTDSELASRTENFTNNYASLGRPTQYYREKRYLYFDQHIPEEYTYQIEYDQEVDELIDGAEAPLIQKRFHTSIVYWASYRGLLRTGQTKDAYSMLAFLKNDMTSIIQEQDLDVERLDGQLIAGGGYNG